MRPLSVYSKYAYYLKQFGTRKKINNILLNKTERLQRKTVLKSRPYQITIDPGNFCNLRCPGCHTGIKHAEMIPASFLKLDDYKQIFDQVKDYALSVALYNWGEPFLNKQLFNMIQYTTEQKVGSTIHTNLNVFNEQMAIETVKSGLTHMYVSIDGASQDVYSKYRVKGDIENVMNHMDLLIRTKKRLKRPFPYISWKYLIFDHNKHELQLAKKMAQKIGVNAFESFHGYPKLMDIYEESQAFVSEPTAFKSMKSVCSSLWSKIYIHSDGTVFPCSLAFRENESFGNLLNEDLEALWNNVNYKNSRKLFSGSFEADSIPLPCRACKYFIQNSCSKVHSN